MQIELGVHVADEAGAARAEDDVLTPRGTLGEQLRAASRVDEEYGSMST